MTGRVRALGLPWARAVTNRPTCPLSADERRVEHAPARLRRHLPFALPLPPALCPRRPASREREERPSVCSPLIASGVPQFRHPCSPQGCVHPVKGKRERPSPRSERASGEGSQDSRGERGKRRRQQHPATARQGRASPQGRDRPANSCCFLCLKRAGSFPGSLRSSSKLRFSRITPPPGRGAILSLGRESSCVLPFTVTPTPATCSERQTLSLGDSLFCHVTILAKTSRGSTFPHPGAVFSVSA